MKMPLQPEFTHKALEDVSSIQTWTQQRFGELTSQRYDDLLEQAIGDLLADPKRLGVIQHPELPGRLFLYHLRFSRIKSKRGAIEKPRHFIAFQVNHQALTVLRVLHDSMDVTTHLNHASQ
jgi:toxin ParE1/3/4